MIINEQLIADASTMTLEDFVKKHKPLNQHECVSKVYIQLRNQHCDDMTEEQKPIPSSKRITFAVIQRKLPKNDFETPVDTEQPKQNRSGEIGRKREARIIELIRLGKPVKSIIDIMTSEGYKVHAPQISNVRIAHKL